MGKNTAQVFRAGARNKRPTVIPSAAEAGQPKLRRKHIGILRLNQDYGAPLICFYSVIIPEIYAFLPPDSQEKAE